MKSSIFEIKGYTKEYFVKKKLIGSIKLTQPDRTEYGYSGKIIEVLNDDVILSNNKTIKKGTEVMTEVMPICGRARIEFFGSKKQQIENNNQNK